MDWIRPEEIKRGEKGLYVDPKRWEEVKKSHEEWEEERKARKNKTGNIFGITLEESSEDFNIVRQAMEEEVDSSEIRERKYKDRQRSYIRSLETELRQITARQQVLERTIARLKENLKEEE